MRKGLAILRVLARSVGRIGSATRRGLLAASDELMLMLALALVAIGFWSVWRPGAYLVPGAVLLWIALPTRRTFVDRSDSSVLVKGKPR